MALTSDIEIDKLSLDLKNFRTTPQIDEIAAVKAMISIKPDRFFGVMESIIEDGYISIENLIVLKVASKLVVREGNRRLAIMKLLHGELNCDDFQIPESIKEKIRQLDDKWKKSNNKVPCSIHEPNEADLAEKIVGLTHAKGEKASRDPWSSVARARYDRDTKKIIVPHLDILEKYLRHGNNLTGIQKDRWSGDYPITVLDEAIRKIYSRFNVKSTIELAQNYPSIPQLEEFEEILNHIGIELIKFETIRNTKDDFAEVYGIFPVVAVSINMASSNSATVLSNSTPTNQTTQSNLATISTAISNQASSQSTQNNSSSSATQSTNTTATPRVAAKAYATNDPKHINSLLKKFTPRGNSRQKVVSIRDELKKLKINTNPLAFCLLLRSIFEISAKVYCDENGIDLKKKNNKGQEIDKTLVELLNGITKHLTNNNSNQAMTKKLYGATTEMSQPGRILSVTSMNQLVHNPLFSITSNDLCISFGNIYPLLEAMN